MDLEVALGKSKKSRSRKRTENPLGLLASIIAQDPSAPASEHIAALTKLMRLESYEDYADAAIDEWARIKYSTAYGVAVPPTKEELERRRKERLARQKAEQAAADRARVKLVGNVLKHVMPNGKPLGDCTGIECTSFGGWLTKVGAVVGNKLVKDVLSNRQLIKLATKSP
jgi:aminopeptidase N